MVTKKTSTPKVVTPQILKKEVNRLDEKIDSAVNRLDAKIDGVEKRLDAKIDSAVRSMKDYIDSRFNALDTKFTKRFDKLEVYFEQLVGMIMQQNKKIDTALERLDNHNVRITKLKERAA